MNHGKIAAFLAWLNHWKKGRPAGLNANRPLFPARNHRVPGWNIYRASCKQSVYFWARLPDSGSRKRTAKLRTMQLSPGTKTFFQHVLRRV